MAALDDAAVGTDRDDGMDVLRSSVGGEDLDDTGMKSAGD